MTAAVGSAGIPFAAVPFLSAWNPSAKAKAVGAPVKVDISKIQVGQKIQVAWRKQPVFVIRHSKEALANLSQIEEKLDDPQSNNIDEPYRDINPTRSTSNEFTVIAGVCTHLGCSPKYYPKMEPQPWDETWIGGFFYSPYTAIIFLSIGAGAIFQVMLILLKWLYQSEQKLVQTSIVSGVGVGMLIMYITSILV